MADRDHVRERAFGALAAVVALALGVGVVLAVGAYAAARMVGLTGGSGQQPTARPVAAASRAPSPTGHASRTPSPTPSPSSAKPKVSAAAQSAHDQQPRRKQQAHAAPHQHRRAHRHAHTRRHQHHRRHRQQRASGTVTLHASASRVSPMARVDLDGRCGCGSGTTLVVQWLEHGQWSRFPATATASGGRFHTWVMTGRHGVNRFRVVAPGGHASNPVTITVR
jgi:hypothetical protein